MNDVIEQIFSYIRGVWRYRWYMLVAAWFLCVVGWVFVHKMPDRYEATAKVLVDTQNFLSKVLDRIAIKKGQHEVEQQVQLMTKTLLSMPNIKRIAQMTDLDLRARTDAELDALWRGLQRDIELTRFGRDNIWEIVYEHEEPAVAKAVVQALVTLFVESSRSNSNRQAEDAQRFLDGQLADYEARLLESEERLKEFRRRHVGRMPGEGGDYYARLRGASDELDRAKLELNQTLKLRDELRRQVEGEEPSVNVVSLPENTGPVPGLTQNTSFDAQIADAKARMNNLLLRYTSRHPDVQILKLSIASLEEQRDAELVRLREQAALAAQAASAVSGLNSAPDPAQYSPVYQELKVALGQVEAQSAALQVTVKEYGRRKQELESLVYVIPEIEAELVALNRDYDVTKRNYEVLLARKEATTITTDQHSTTDEVEFKVVEPPRVPIDPSSPNRPIYMSGVFAAGLGAAIAFAFLMSQIFSTFDDRRTLMRVTNIPVFGTVSMIYSRADVLKARVGLVVFLLLFLLLFAAYGVLIWQQFNSAAAA